MDVVLVRLEDSLVLAPAEEDKPDYVEHRHDKQRVGQQQTAQTQNVQQPTNSLQPQNNAPQGGENQEEKKDDLPF